MLHNLDSDSSKIIEAVRSTGVVITEAMRLYVDYIVSNMKSIGTWDLCNAVYGFVGGTAASHKFNWKDLRDVDAAFRLTYGGTVTHSANGMQGNGTTGYADTKLESNILTDDNISLSIYLSINNNNGGVYLRSGGAQNISLLRNASVISSSTNSVASYTIDDSKGYFLSSKTSTSNHIVLKNGVKKIITLSSNVNAQKSIIPFFIGAAKDLTTGIISGFSNAGFSFSTIGAGLTDTQAQQQSQIVTNAQNILNRA
jgi:hypothetical protein